MSKKNYWIVNQKGSRALIICPSALNGMKFLTVLKS